MSVCLEGRDFANQLKEVNILLETASAKTTFWGKKVIELPNNKGSFSLEEIAKKTTRAASERCSADNLTIEERLAGVDIVKKLIIFYKNTDDQIKICNFFTKFLSQIREFSFSPYTSRFYIEDGYTEGHFRGFSKEKYKEKFGVDYVPHSPYSDGGFGPPFRITIREAVLRDRR